MFEVSWVSQGREKEVLRVFTVSFKGVSRKFKGCFKEVLGKFQGCFKKDAPSCKHELARLSALVYLLLLFCCC